MEKRKWDVKDFNIWGEPNQDANLEKYTGMSEVVVIPDGVTSIYEGAFWNCEFINEIIIPDSVTEIDGYTFINLKKLRKVSLSKNIKVIKDSLFYCSGIKEIIIPENVIEIQKEAFKTLYSCKIILNDTCKIDTEAFGIWRNETQATLNSRPKMEVHYTNNYLYKDELNHNNFPSYVTFINDDEKSSGGCYVATCVYGSYDCPQVWTLRRFRDYTLAESVLGRAFIKTYYAISPTIVKIFGKYNWFRKIWKSPLDKMVVKLNKNGVENTPYND